MIVTNKTNLPAPLVNAIRNDDYDSGDSDITATQLIRPPRQVALEKDYKEEIEDDASDMIWALIGKIGHLILEKGARGTKEIAETRLKTSLLGWRVSGQADLWLKMKTLLDYKFTTVWSMKDGVKPEWEQQLNLLWWLCELNEIEVLGAQIVCIFRDWSKLEAKRNSDYPQHQVQVYQVPDWGTKKRYEYSYERVVAHQNARIGLPQCTDVERWARPNKWAAMKEGRKSAVKVGNTEAEAQAVVNSGKATHVTLRPGEFVRCANYCRAAKFCKQWKNNLSSIE